MDNWIVCECKAEYLTLMEGRIWCLHFLCCTVRAASRLFYFVSSGGDTQKPV